VTLCTSCGNTLKSEYPRLFPGEERLSKIADLVAANTYDFGELLVELLAENKLKLPANRINRKLAYHAPCHLKAQGIGKPWLSILKSVPGLEVLDLEAGCCGMSGTYGFRTEKYAISMGIGANVFTAIKEYQPDQVISECAGCRMQIEHGTQAETLHPVEVLDQILECRG
ncbi:MAG TPA: heterodisulfide reductase-related iron-sulfur binding cluster, partial [Bacillota bacterium]|nr:heterodisulfide reductase-related iron-sulfur binding cluster [Bacillota bacterium]